MYSIWHFSSLTCTFAFTVESSFTQVNNNSSSINLSKCIKVGHTLFILLRV